MPVAIPTDALPGPARQGGGSTPDLLPRYGQLPLLADTNEHQSWAVFGGQDELGTLNFITEAVVAAAATEIQLGRTVCLSLPLTVPSPPLVPSRAEISHRVYRHRGGSDDSLDGFYLQCSSQWDGLAHVRYGAFGYYGGRTEAQLDAGDLGIDRVARRGITGRGVLVDVAGYRKQYGPALDPRQRHPITPSLLEDVLHHQGTAVHSGDVLLIRTGWLAWYLDLDDQARADLAGALGRGALTCPGLDPGRDTARWLWDHRVSAVAADNPGVETFPVIREEGFLHRRLIALLGMPLGELFALDELAGQCQALGRWSFFLSSSPLNLPVGVGSPNNAHALL